MILLATWLGMMSSTSSALMQNTSRKEDFCFRYGGEEFVILTNVEREEEVFRIAERLRTRFAETPNLTGRGVFTISLGVSSFRKEDDQPDEIMEKEGISLSVELKM